jgi:hypothetical protein
VDLVVDDVGRMTVADERYTGDGCRLGLEQGGKIHGNLHRYEGCKKVFLTQLPNAPQ